MTKTIALAVLLAVSACKGKKKEEAPVEPTPMPTTGSGSGSGSAMTPATGSAIAMTDCEVKFDVKVGSLSWTSTTAKGAMADGIDPAQVTAATKTAIPAGTTCHATISADDKVIYQDIITVMDAVLAGGISDIELDMKGAAAASDTGTSASGDLKTMPVVAVTTDAVLVNNKEVGKLADAKLDAALATAFADAKKASPDAGKIILQADKATTWAHLTRVVGAAKTAGFGDVLFAIKNK